jgi:hypothetical protein
MTRLTNDIRDSIHRKIMSDLPTMDYPTQIHALVQKVIVENMDPAIRAVYDNPDLRSCLRHTQLEVVKGNAHVPLWSSDDTKSVVGLPKGLIRLQVDDLTARTETRRDTLWGKLVNALNESKLVDKYFEQKDLYDTVSRRVKINVYAATTVKRLYDVLEPELHHYIPKISDTPMLPATVAPVVDDLRKLGKTLPKMEKDE